ncbi:nicotinate phosphoribosyltransferase [Patulibacter brassicae]|uniref:nicotinate phosphoribosyltransferase n=1 Tax=Patulibacter brassicae TaxID=1705717 RepID=A0ABU4VM68_9ACTN|nr:nicotinate phosphoribosyltransferase [Patulibacter brassicae]MDX8152934.1 nicotinate phosphoribosyltransferase [Patulibacter brassicae]
MSVLRTDLYTLTMADGFVRHGRDDLVSFEVVVRRRSEDRPWVMLAGVQEAVTALRELRADPDELAWLRQDGRFSAALLARLAALRFTGTAWALPEGTCLPAEVPLLRITAPRVEATLVEPVVLAALNYGTRIATNAAGIVAAAGGRPVQDFSLRRLDGPEAGLATARAAWLAGFAGTALPEAGARYGIPTLGTMAHHQVLARGEDHEQDAFAEALRDHPGTTLLVDSFDVDRGVARAIAAAQEVGVPLAAIRIDSGDLAEEARRARAALDAAGQGATRIVLSGDLDAAAISSIVGAGAPVDAFGVGTRLRSGEPLGGVYKLCAQHDEPDPLRRWVMKRSPGKETDPGVHGVARVVAGDVVGHRIHLAHEAQPGTALMRPVLRRGAPVPGALDLDAARERAARERELAGRATFAPVVRSAQLLALRERLARPATLRPDDALVVVDVQHDFLPGGALGVPTGDRVLAPIARLLRAAREGGATIVASRDWHPADHVSFAERGGPWPPHCVAGTPGAELHPSLDLAGATVVSKAEDRDRDAYSAFDGTGLLELLRERRVRRVVVCGLATDYCVRATALDALDGGLAVAVATDAIAAVEVSPGDGDRTLAELREAGASLVTAPPA